MISETTIVAIIAAVVGGIPPTIFALAAFRKGAEAVVESKKTTEKADVIIGKADEIHTATNGHLSKMTAALEASSAHTAVLDEKIIGLEKLIANMAAPAPKKEDT